MQFCHTTQYNRCLKLRECAIGILTIGMSTRAVTISRFKFCFREFGSAPNWPYHLSPGPLHLASSPVGSSETSHPDSWWNWRVFLPVIKPPWGEKLILIGWAWLPRGSAWLPSGWGYALPWLHPCPLISIEWFPYLKCTSVKSLKLLHVALIFLFSI